MRVVVGVSMLLALAGPAGARSLPKAEADPKAVACPDMGEGFVRIQGSDTCVKMSGIMRVEGAAIRGGAVLSPDGGH